MRAFRPQTRRGHDHQEGGGESHRQADNITLGDVLICAQKLSLGSMSTGPALMIHASEEVIFRMKQLGTFTVGA